MILTIFFIYLFSSAPFGNRILLTLENKYPAFNSEVKGDIDHIIILGGGIIKSSPEENGKGSLVSEALKRVVYGAILAKKFNLPVIVSGGRVFNEIDSEAESEIAKKTLIKLGIDSNRIFEESQSRNTRENALYIKEKFKIKKALLVTSASHMPRSVHSFKSNNIDVIPAPTAYSAARGEYGLLSYFPNIDDLNNTYAALREYAGYIFYLIRY